MLTRCAYALQMPYIRKTDIASTRKIGRLYVKYRVHVKTSCAILLSILLIQVDT